MTKNPPGSPNKTPAQNSPETKYLDLWEENTRLMAANGIINKTGNQNG